MKDREEVLEIVRQLNIIDDTLFQKLAGNLMWKYKKQMMIIM